MPKKRRLKPSVVRYLYKVLIVIIITLVLLIGMITAFIVSIIAIKFLLKYIKHNDFKIFGYYRIILGIIVLLYFILK